MWEGEIYHPLPPQRSVNCGKKSKSNGTSYKLMLVKQIQRPPIGPRSCWTWD